MSLNKLYAFPLLVLLPLASVAKCDPSQTAPDHSKVCKAPNGYKEAGKAARVAKGNFYGCIKNSKPCVIKYKQGGRKKTISLYRADFFTIPKSAKAWSDSNCGTIFRKNA